MYTPHRRPERMRAVAMAALLVVPVCGLAQNASGFPRAFPEPTVTTIHEFQAEAVVTSVERIYEDSVIGRNCQPVYASSPSDGPEGSRPQRQGVRCIPITQRKATAFAYVANYKGISFSGTTYRPLRVGDTVHVNGVTLLNPLD